MRRHVNAQQTVDATLEEVLEVIARDWVAVLGPPTGSPVDPDTRETTLRAMIAGVEIHRQVEIHAGPRETVNPDARRLVVRWHAVHGEQLLPVMHGELEFAARSVDPPRCAVTFAGHYEPPLGVLGAIGDTLVGHRIATETVVSFVDGVCGRLVLQLGLPSPSVAPSDGSDRGRRGR